MPAVLLDHHFASFVCFVPPVDSPRHTGYNEGHSLEEAITLLREAKEERAEADAALREVLKALGL